MERIVVVGSLNMDVIINVPHIPKIGETILAKGISYSLGGKGANQAVAASKLNGDVHMIGRLGKDLHGKELYDGLIINNVNPEGIIFDEMLPTGSAYINVSESGENNIVVNPGSNSGLDIEQIERFEYLLNDAKYCIVQFEIPIKTVEYISELCKLKNIKLIINPAPASKIDFSIFKGSYLIIPNESELDIIVEGSLSIEEKAKILFNQGFENVIVTLGEKGSILLNSQGIKYFKAQKIDKVVDTTAAGDSFIGALVTFLSKGKNLEESINLASIAAAITVGHEGAQMSLPNTDMLNEFISNLILE